MFAPDVEAAAESLKPLELLLFALVSRSSFAAVGGLLTTFTESSLVILRTRDYYRYLL